MNTFSPSVISIDSDRLWQSIKTLAKIGALPTGGVQRIAYSAEDRQARYLVQKWMLEADMSVKIDAAGNIIGTYRGKQPHLPALATGSHIDTVPNAGHYDGVFGVLAGLEVVHTLKEHDIQLDHSLEVIVFTDEEGSMIGSKAMSGYLMSDPASYRRPDGVDIQTCLESIGGKWNNIEQSRRTSRNIAAFVELHVEQGPVLETAGKAIGIVEGIVGQRRYRISVTGQACHAGTTPMNMRQDALVAAAQIILSANQIANSPGQQVATVGWLQVHPNVANTIPGLVELQLDIRDLSNTHLDELMAKFIADLDEIANRTNTKIHIEPFLRNEPVLCAKPIQATIASVCEEFNLSYMYLPSRASHDAQELAKFTDMAMIFVPSQAGVSHAETEYTSPIQCAEGANVLLYTLLKLDTIYK